MMNTEEPTKIRRVLKDPDKYPFIKRYWINYVIFRKRYWRWFFLFVFAAFVFSIYPYFSYFPFLLPEEWNIPVEYNPIVIYDDANTFWVRVEVPKYATLSRQAHFKFLLQQSKTPTDAQTALFAVNAIGTGPTKKTEADYDQVSSTIWESSGEINYEIPNVPGNQLEFGLNISPSGYGAIEEISCPSVPLLCVDVIQAPNSIVRFIIALASLGFFGKAISLLIEHRKAKNESK